jgi:hypothetical protein
MRAQAHIKAGSGQMRRALRVSEQQDHMALVKHLEVRAKPGVFWCHIPNGEYRAKVTAAILSGMGVKRGVPDMMFISGGRTYFLELKREGGRKSDAQNAVHAQLRRAGAIVDTAFGLDEALDALEGWGLIRGVVGGNAEPSERQL